MANSLKIIKKNMTAKKTKTTRQPGGLIVPFYARFIGSGRGTAGPPANWLTRR